MEISIMKVYFGKLLIVTILLFFIGTNAISKEVSVEYDGLTIPDMSGKAITVLGPIAPDLIGVTLPHEHLFIDFWVPLDQPGRWEKLGVKPPETVEEIEIWHQKITARNRTRMMKHFHRNRDGFTLDSLDDTITEVLAYRQLGGKTIVDVTTIGLNRQPKKLHEVALKTGVNIIMGTGFYRAPWHPEDMDNRSVSNLTEQMVREIVEGINDTGVKAGIIGEIPAEHLVFDPKDSNEVKVLRAAARASQLTGAAITLHSSFSNLGHIRRSVDILEEEGADLSRVVVGHIANVASADMDFLEYLLN